MAVATLPVTDPKASSSAGINLSTATYTACIAGASNGLECQWADVSGFVLKFTGLGTGTFTFTIPTPANSGLGDIGSFAAPKLYSVPAGQSVYIVNADAFRDPTTNKVKFISNNSSCFALAIS